jgi:hypothetical protein
MMRNEISEFIVSLRFPLPLQLLLAQQMHLAYDLRPSLLL